MTAPDPSLAQTLPTAGTSGPVLISERYELRRELGRGGQSQVFVAFDRQLAREVALKVPLPGPDGKVDPKTEARFLREARITALLDHPNIVTVHEIGRTGDGRLFCAQRLVQRDGEVRGGTLSSAFHEATSLEQRLALLPRFLDVCNAVAFAHQKGVVHRDLKPDNVVLGRLGETVVLDWGLGRVLSETEASASPSSPGDETLDGQVLGTPLYMSPEQARGERDKVDRRSDVWSLGVMLYELLAGRTPFLGPGVMVLLEQVRTAEVPPLERVSRGVPPALAAIVARTLHRDPSARYPDAGALAGDLSDFLAGRAVGSYDYSAPELIRLFVRRHRTASAVGAISLAVLLIAVVALARSVRENRESLAEAFVEKGRLAEGALRWEEAAVWYAAAKDFSAREDAAAGLRVVWPRTQQRSQLLVGHKGAVRALLSAANGQTLYSGGVDHTVRAWSVATGTTLRVFEGHTLPVNALALSPDGYSLFSGGEDNAVRRWDTRTGASAVLLTLPDAVNALAISPDGAQLLIGGEDRRVWRVVLDAPAAAATVFGVHQNPVYATTFSPDGALVASASWRNGEVQVQRAATGELVATLRGHEGSVIALAFDPSGNTLASAGRDTTVRFWRTADWQQVHTLLGNSQKVYAVSWSDDGELFASAGTDGTSRVWAGTRRRPLPGASLGRDDELFATTFLRGTSVLAVGGRRGLISLRTISDESPLQKNLAEVTSLTELDDGRLALQMNTGIALVTPDLKRVALIGEPGDSVETHLPAQDCVLNRAGTRAYGTSSHATVAFYDLTNHRLLAARDGHTNRVAQFALSPDGALLASAGKDGRALIWDTSTFDLRAALPQGADGLFAVAWAPNGEWLATGSYDHTVRIFETRSWRQVHQLVGHEHGVRTVAFSPDSTLVASGGWDRSVRLWRPTDGAAVSTLHGHQDVVTALDFSPDGKRLASASFDGSIRLWDVERHLEVVRFTPDEGRLNRVLFSRDGKRLFYARQGLYRIDLVDEATPAGLDEVLQRTRLSMQGLRLVWNPVP